MHTTVRLSQLEPSLDSLLLELAGRLVNMPADPSETVQAVLNELRQALDIDCVGLSLIPSGSDSTLKATHYHAALGPCPALDLFHSEPGLTEQLRRGQIVVYPPPGKSLPSRAAAAGEGRVLLLPIRAGGRWRGAMGLAWHHGDEQWEPAAITSLQTFAHLAAQMIEQAQAGDPTGRGGSWIELALEAGGVDAGFWDLATGEFHATDNMTKRSPDHMFLPAANFAEYLERIHPDHRERLILAVEDAINRGKPVSGLEFISLLPDGRQMWVEFNGRVRRDVTGAPHVLEGSVIDVTKRKRIEQELNQQRQVLLRQTRLMEQTEAVASIGGWEWDLVNDTLYFTPQLCRIYGFEPDRPLPPPEEVLARCTPESETALRAAIRSAMRTGDSYDLRLDIVTVYGKPVPVRTTGRVTMEDGRAVRLYGVLQDITRTARLERQLREVQAIYKTTN